MNSMFKIVTKGEAEVILFGNAKLVFFKSIFFNSYKYSAMRYYMNYLFELLNNSSVGPDSSRIYVQTTSADVCVRYLLIQRFLSLILLFLTYYLLVLPATLHRHFILTAGDLADIFITSNQKCCFQNM